MTIHREPIGEGSSFTQNLFFCIILDREVKKRPALHNRAHDLINRTTTKGGNVLRHGFCRRRPRDAAPPVFKESVSMLYNEVESRPDARTDVFICSPVRKATNINARTSGHRQMFTQTARLIASGLCEPAGRENHPYGD